MINFPQIFNGVKITREMALDKITNIIKFIEENFDLKKDKYCIAIKTLKWLLHSISLFQSHTSSKPIKKHKKITIEVIEEVSKHLVKNKETLSIIKSAAEYTKNMLDKQLD